MFDCPYSGFTPEASLGQDSARIAEPTAPTPLISSVDSTRSDRPWLLVSDVDDTLTGDAAALERLAAILEANRARLRVALNSSRPADSVDGTLAQVFPEGFSADAIITAMGTEIRVAGQQIKAWRDRFDDWPRAAIAEVVIGLGYPAHADEFQTPLKASFAVPRGSAQDQVLAELRRRGLPHNAVASGTDDLDLLPPGAGKDHATVFLARHMGVDIERRLIVAGDSANDLAMFAVAAGAIAVGNARPELLEAMPRDRSYHAKARHAGGVLEGLWHFGVLD